MVSLQWRVLAAVLLLAACDPGEVILVQPTGQGGSGSSIRVLVLRPDGEPAAGAVVHYQRPDTWVTNWRSVTTDSAGVTTLADVRPGSLYWIAAEQPDPVMGVLGGGEKAYPPGRGSVDVTLELAPPRTVGVVISEVFMEQPLSYSAGYDGAKYVEVANNGDGVVFLDGMLIGKVYPGWDDHQNQLAKVLDERGVSVIGIALDSQESAAGQERQFELQFPVIEFPSEPLQRMYRAAWTPATLVVDGDGRILHVHMGMLAAGADLDKVLAVAGVPQTN